MESEFEAGAAKMRAGLSKHLAASLVKIPSS